MKKGLSFAPLRAKRQSCLVSGRADHSLRAALLFVPQVKVLEMDPYFTAALAHCQPNYSLIPFTKERKKGEGITDT